MCCRPDAATWRSFEQLSGGQQALAALALSLAIHSTFAMAWFLCDEVDAALDVLRAAHLADFMAMSSTQFIVVSHKPQVRCRQHVLASVEFGCQCSDCQKHIVMLKFSCVSHPCKSTCIHTQAQLEHRVPFFSVGASWLCQVAVVICTLSVSLFHMQVFERANMLLMLYQSGATTTGMCIPSGPLPDLLSDAQALPCC